MTFFIKVPLNGQGGQIKREGINESTRAVVASG